MDNNVLASVIPKKLKLSDYDQGVTLGTGIYLFTQQVALDVSESLHIKVLGKTLLLKYLKKLKL
jgi:hypothetical protein